MALESKEQLEDTAKQLQRELSRHGWISSEVSDYIVLSSIGDAKRIGDHLRYMGEEAARLISEDLLDAARAHIHFIEGVIWSLGLYSLQEIQAMNSSVDDEEEWL